MGEVPQKCPRTVKEVPQKCPRTVKEVSQKCPRTVKEVPQKCPRTVKEVPQKCPKTDRALRAPCLRRMRMAKKRSSRLHERLLNTGTRPGVCTSGKHLQEGWTGLQPLQLQRTEGRGLAPD